MKRNCLILFFLGSLSDREMRILMSKFNTVPLTSDAIHTFLEQLRNCSHILDNSTNVVRHPSERQYGYDVPPVTERLLRNCEVITKQLNNSNTKESKFKHEIVGEDDVAFKMIKNNVTHVLLQLDQLRKSKKKFVCLNDNIEHDKPNASVVKGLLVDFYESLFPSPSQFELPKNSRNKFLNVDELNSWKNEKRRLDSISDGILIVSLIVILFFVCKCPIMYAIRRSVAVLRRCMRTPRMITSSTSTRLLTVWIF